MRTGYLFIIGIIILSLAGSNCYKEKALIARAEFSIEVIDNNYSAPVHIRLQNNSEGASRYNWSLQGGFPESSGEKDPGIIEYKEAGTYTITLKASNQYGGEDQKSLILTVDSLLRAHFSLINTASQYPPVHYHIDNTSAGATSFHWQFEGGEPASSTQRQPGDVIFNSPGSHIIRLTISNGRVSSQKDTTIVVDADLQADFSLSWEAIDNDLQVPFTALIHNHSQQATHYQWQAPGGSLTNPGASEPTITYTTPGSYTITLTASNDKVSKSISKTITLQPNSGLYSFSSVRIGINTAQNTIGCYFSSRLGRVMKSSEVTPSNGPFIDFGYFGLNSSFSYNKIIAPDSVTQFTFSAIPGAIDADIINKIENSESNMSEADFNDISNGAQLQALSITETPVSYGAFSSSVVPRIVLLKLSDGRKAAIKINQFIYDADNSFMLCDIKIMK